MNHQKLTTNTMSLLFDIKILSESYYNRSPRCVQCDGSMEVTLLIIS